MKRRMGLLAFLGGIVGGMLFSLSGCTKEQAARAQKAEQNVQSGVKIADEALSVVDQLVGVAAPGSTAAKTLDKVTVIAQKVDDKVQHITIIIPVTDKAAPATTAAPASRAGPAVGQ